MVKFCYPNRRPIPRYLEQVLQLMHGKTDFVFLNKVEVPEVRISILLPAVQVLEQTSYQEEVEEYR